MRRPLVCEVRRIIPEARLRSEQPSVWELSRREDEKRITAKSRSHSDVISRESFDPVKIRPGYIRNNEVAAVRMQCNHF